MKGKSNVRDCIKVTHIRNYITIYALFFKVLETQLLRSPYNRVIR
jgi:hypothetical protein